MNNGGDAMTGTETALYARTFSAATRHIINPDRTYRTLCGSAVSLSEHYIGDDGEPRTCESWMVRDLPQCERCQRSADKRGMVHPS